MIMTIVFNGQCLFLGSGHLVWSLSWERDQVERSFAGLNGVVSLDLGRRTRKLKQCGQLLAESVSGIKKQIDTINDCIDGRVHELVDQNGMIYSSVRMDSFSPAGPLARSGRVFCKYEISYTQLR